MDTVNLELRVEWSPLKNTWKLNEHWLHIKGLKAARKQVGEAETQSHWKTTTKSPKQKDKPTPPSGGISKIQKFSPRGKWSVLHIWNTHPQILPGGDELPECLALKTNRDYFQENRGNQLRKLVFKGRSNLKHSKYQKQPDWDRILKRLGNW